MRSESRIELLDFMRGVALIAMTVFHFGFDLELLGFKEPGYASQLHWKYFARAIASSFLILTGFSLYLAHHQHISWEKWRLRMLKIVAAAVLITIATYFATPHQFIFFGILHAIAFASLAGLLFLKLNAVATLCIAVSVFWVGNSYESALFDHPIWWWTGLSQAPINSSDYVPVFPWFSAPLIGIVIAKTALQFGLLEMMSRPQLNARPFQLVKFIGRNSLIYYLLHQPIMIGLLFAVLYLQN